MISQHQPFVVPEQLSLFDFVCKWLGLAGFCVLILWCTFPSTIPVRFGRVLFTALGLMGCASFDQGYLQEPTQTYSCTQVHWKQPQEIQTYCPLGAAACGTLGNGVQLNNIWAVKPTSFQDFWRVYQLGHEFLHNLGGRHE